jgi:hypothetical protein
MSCVQQEDFTGRPILFRLFQTPAGLYRKQTKQQESRAGDGRPGQGDCGVRHRRQCLWRKLGSRGYALVALDEQSDADFSGSVGALPAVCASEPDIAFLIRVGAGKWIANGVVLR